MAVDSRVAMGRMLTERMQGTYEELRDEQRQGTDRSLLKTWVVETSAPEADGLPPAEVLSEAFSVKTFGDNVRPRVDAVDDDLVTVRLRHDSRDVEFYIDTSDARYWLLHSLDRSTSVDWAVERAVHDSLNLDTLWLTPELLEWVSTLGYFRGLGLDFDRRPIVGDSEQEEEDAPLTYLKMQLWGNKARRVLESLRAEDAFPSETTLAKVKVKYWPDSRLPDVFSVDDVKYNGKVTARGTSYEAHRGLLTKVVEAYNAAVTRIERDFSLTYDAWNSGGNTSSGFNIKGDALHVRFSRPIKDMEEFLTKVFAASEPFRLWGVPVEYARNVYKVEAFDLHVGSPIRFEVRLNGIRIYLPRGACGNSVARFLTNVQHHFDAAASLMGPGGERLGFQP